VTDSATLSGTNAATATGTVTYDVYSDNACSVPVNTGTAQTITTPGTLPPSSPITLTSPGTYYWQASYSGDTGNGPSASTCGSEVETVATPQPTTVSTWLSGGGQSGGTISVPEGTAVTDSATLSGTNAATATGTVTYDVYSDNACSVPVNTGTEQTITTPGTLPPSSPVTLTSPGTYYWQASYSGDTGNGPSASTCGSEVETVESPPTAPNLNDVIQVEMNPMYNGETVDISSPDLQASCTSVSFETLQGGSPSSPTVSANSIPVVVDADGNVTVVVNGVECLPGLDAIDAEIPGATPITATTNLVVDPPQMTFPSQVAGYPQNEVESGNTLASGDSDVYAVFSVEAPPGAAEKTATISSPQLLKQCGQGSRWESNAAESPFIDSRTATATIDDNGNATFVFKGASCAAGAWKVKVTVGHHTYRTKYYIDPPAVTYSGPLDDMYVNASPDPVILTGE
jgi:hypothetical protein